MMFPRGFVGAMAYWNFNASIDSQSDAFVTALWDLNDRVISAGGSSCPTKCHCDQLTACGAPYIPPAPPAPPAAGRPLATVPCEASFSPNQQWVLTADSTLQLKSNAALCVQDPGSSTYPATLGSCAGAAKVAYDAVKKWFTWPSGECMDVRESDQALGSWACGSKAPYQPNQQYEVDADGTIVSALPGGPCVTSA
jgi:hypothetical protein